MNNRYVHTYESIWYKVLHYGLEFIGRYYSTYRGFVVDNNDPEGLGRVRVICPSLIPNDKVGDWAFPKGAWGGNDYGTQMLPQVNDMVFLEFDHGNLDYPIWQFAGYGENEKPEEFSNPNIYGFKTPKGTIITVDDGTTDEDWSIRIKSRTNSEYVYILPKTTEIESETIKLGKGGNYKAVHGETNNENLNAICEKLNDLVQLFATHTHASNGTPPAQAAQATQLIAEIQQIANGLPNALSDKVKLD